MVLGTLTGGRKGENCILSERCQLGYSQRFVFDPGLAERGGGGGGETGPDSLSPEVAPADDGNRFGNWASEDKLEKGFRRLEGLSQREWRSPTHRGKAGKEGKLRSTAL